MPKERFHLFIAERYLNTFADSLPSALRRESRAFLIGALSPDTLFYDVPSFSQSPLGDALHQLLEREYIEPVRNWLATTTPPRAKAGRQSLLAAERRFAWGLGFACHVLTDEAWHPAINELSTTLDFCKKKGLNFLDCHRLIESEHEALWLGRSEEPGRTTDLLRLFRKDPDWLREIASFYRQFLESAGLKHVPAEKKILKCYRDQNFCLRSFANATMGRLRDSILDFPPTRYIGSLISPSRTFLPALLSQRLSPERNLFSDHFLEKAFTSLATPLSELAARLSPSPPG